MLNEPRDPQRNMRAMCAVARSNLTKILPAQNRAACNQALQVAVGFARGNNTQAELDTAIENVRVLAVPAMTSGLVSICAALHTVWFALIVADDGASAKASIEVAARVDYHDALENGQNQALADAARDLARTARQLDYDTEYAVNNLRVPNGRG